ncbi:5-oxoprolinase subunit C family protein [Tessaracoccus antarcticus]|uniref:Biotin-dependent carboxyltransferase family protein n=1 Tax=Tessaracoccus antarcticus TaxID=2479848 RepID=A0A3M0G248_9ACTN|nr:biotin-dependent carboxyltransferase family protein [Tessaracoccus antarcticus]RMB59004.1 biotin-dependent carboxyltransferase family protein [Tessaracoccus antarcticus]
MNLHVTAVGPLATIQDLGRPGWMHVGVSPSGAADRESHRLANALLGNDAGAATIEVLLGGLELLATQATWVALTGADCGARVDGRAIAWAGPVALRAGQRLRLGFSTAGLRAYVAVSGGVAVEPVLGSRSRDTLSGLGPEPLRTGMVLPAGARPVRPTVDAAPAQRPSPDALYLVAQPGPHMDWLLHGLDATHWQVSPDSDRVGVRLQGRALPRRALRVGTELPSAPMVRGALQLPPSGHPVVFLADHPVTGGYPVVAVLDDTSCDTIAQARPGQRLSMHITTVRR